MSGKDSDQMRAFLRALGHEIRSQRQLRKLTREKLAEEVGISPTTMGRIERDGPADVGDTWRIAEVLGISFPDMVRRAEENGQRLYADEFDTKARVYQRVSDLTDPDAAPDQPTSDPAAGSGGFLASVIDMDELASTLSPEELEAQRAVARLDQHARNTRPTRDRKSEMQQMQDTAARDEGKHA